MPISLTDRMRDVDRRLTAAIFANDRSAIDGCVADLRFIADMAQDAGRAGAAAILRAHADEAERVRVTMEGTD